jgi:hypothetical protein
VASYEKTCKRCGDPKTVDTLTVGTSDWYIVDGKPKPPCKDCINVSRRKLRAKTTARRIALEGNLGKLGRGMAARVMIDWCPRSEWPRLRYFAGGQFELMMKDGVCTPGMYVTQHDRQSVVWGQKGEPQWLEAAVDKRGRKLYN